MSAKYYDRTTVKTDSVSRSIAAMIRDNGSKFFSVTFVKKDGETRTLTGRVFHDKKHDGHNNAAHYEKYVTIVIRGRDEKGNRRFRNVNTETIKSLHIGGRHINFE